MSAETTTRGKVAVLGGGAWGTALAHSQCLADNDTALWVRNSATAEQINASRENPGYLPGVSLSPALRATTSAAETMSGASCILVAIPAQSLRIALEQLSGDIPEQIPLILCAKGIERDTGKLPSEVANEVLPGTPVAALSGPSFAADVARGLPTAVTVAAEDGQLAHELATLLWAPQLRCYSSDDLAGIEIGGALKNVLAIAAGIVCGAKLGDSAQAALTTRGFAELRRVGGALGARSETLMGLSGLGDLILTCSSPKSRNFAYGIALGSGKPVDGLPLAEGVATAGIAAKLAAEHRIEAPVIDAVASVLDGSLTVSDAAVKLLARPLKAETA